MAEGWYRQDGADWLLQLHVQPGAKKTEVAGLYDGALKLRLAAPPVDGKANTALLAFVAEAFAIPRRQVELKSGASSRRKVIRVSGSALAPEQAMGSGPDAA
ncbi:DUF167 domain-containing protein [Chitiniphilus eburneus]|uniref:UPF0235 protein FAZ21_06255 n=1 Tax=Chitiniphilus eburneus TaxID=2571148 RepID=A0A4U0Q371_9NEIS|nr:DUF167 domain-containing protein [Chitiniphilus eburneus]TJZ75513.1 YggU family protein [Chitiniphilus eburneus]